MTHLSEELEELNIDKKRLTERLMACRIQKLGK